MPIVTINEFRNGCWITMQLTVSVGFFVLAFEVKNIDRHASLVKMTITNNFNMAT
jgi:hypothetical protein